MSNCPEINEVKASAIKFDLANLELELSRLLLLLKDDAAALGQFSCILSDALQKCEQEKQLAESENPGKARRIPHD